MCKPMNLPRRTKDEDESKSSATSSAQTGVEKVGEIKSTSPVRSRQHPSPAHHAQEDGMVISTEPTTAKKKHSSSSTNTKRGREFYSEEQKEAYTRRLLSNRRAAQASRDRKKFLIEDLNKTVNTLTEEKQQLEELNSELLRQLQESRQEQDRLSNLLRRSTLLKHTQSSPSLGALSSASLSSLLGPQTAQTPAHLGSSAGLSVVNNGSVPYLPSIASQLLSLPPIVHPTTTTCSATLNVNNLLLQQHLQQRLQEARPSTASILSTNYHQPQASGAIHQAQQALQIYQSIHSSTTTSPSLSDNDGKRNLSRM